MKPALLALAALLLASCARRSDSAGEAQRDAPRELPSGGASVNGPVLSYANVVQVVAPAVVTVRSSHRVRAPQQFPFFDDPFFRQFFGGNPRRGGATEVEHALGSGVIVRADGYILTNQHVVDGAEDIRVDLVSRRTFSAKLVGQDSPSDLAVLKISASDLPVLELGNSDQVRVGDVCLAVGNPLGLGESVTAGIVSAKGRETGLSNGSFQDFLQTDAPINQGNSGGALVNTRGELIGINSQILSPSGGGNIGIGFAIPSNMARSVMNQLISRGKVERGEIGVSIQPVTSEIAQSMGLKQVQGVLVASVNPGSPAEKAGLKAGDIILQFNGQNVNDPNTLRNEVAGTAPGSEVTLTILRNGAQQQIRVREGELHPAEQSGQNGPAGGGGGGVSAGKLGLSLVPLTPELDAQLGLKPGTQGLVVQAVDPNGPAAQAGIQPGDVIQQVNRQPVRTADDMRAALAKSDGRPPLLMINRNGDTAFVAVPVQ
ncbi:MAG TPA: DegQ family serine endoprotease [Bryobacteraceae bacterium]|jgi:Do/DeqQ family serine protease|nr:DegQ family serine endoprotease [Bryobacteraceae bacterium]